MVTLRISGARPRARLSAAFVLVTLGLVVAGVSGLFGNARIEWAIVGVINKLLAIGAPVAIVRSVRGHVEVTAQTVMAALSVYLLIRTVLCIHLWTYCPG
jgi:hypothetical protein